MIARIMSTARSEQHGRVRLRSWLLLAVAVLVSSATVMVAVPARAVPSGTALRLVNGGVPGVPLDVSDPNRSANADDGQEVVDLTSVLPGFAGGSLTDLCITIDGSIGLGSTPCDSSDYDSPVASITAQTFRTPVLAPFATDQRSNWSKVLSSADSRTAQNMWMSLSQLTAISTVSASYRHTCAVTTSGGVLCWGDGSFGRLGDGATDSRTSPVKVLAGAGPDDGSGFLTDVVEVSASTQHTCAVTTSGGVLCWGDGGSGRLGDGATTNRTSPVKVLAGAGPHDGSGFLTDVVAVSASTQHTCAVTTSGGVLCWGAGGSGRLGDGATTDRTSPVKVLAGAGPHDGSGFLDDVVAVAAGTQHTCAVTTTGGVLCWGLQTSGRLGNGLTTDVSVSSPVRVVAGERSSGSGNFEGAVSVAAGLFNSCASTGDGGVFCWGNGSLGQLGHGGTPGNQGNPVQVHGVGNTGVLADVVSVTAGTRHLCALQTTGSVVCWGNGQWGNLGDSSFTTTQSWPVRVVAGVGPADGGALDDVVAVAAGEQHSCAATVDGSVLCWGAGSLGQLGTDVSTTFNRPVFTMPGEGPGVALGTRSADGREYSFPSSTFRAGDCVRFIGTGTVLDGAGHLSVKRVDGGNAVVNIAGHDPGAAPTAGRLVYSDCVGMPSTISVASDVLVNGRRSVIVTWYRMPTWGSSWSSPVSNTYQVVIIERGVSGYDVEFNYGSMTDHTGGGYSAGGALRYPIGWSGYANGAAVDSHELVDTVVGSALVDSGANPLVANSLNSDVAGRYVIPFRSGASLTGAWTDPAMDGTATLATGFVPGGAPAAVSAITSPTSAVVSWTPGTEGVADTTGYTVSTSSGGGSCSTTTTSCTVSALTAGSAYTFSVVANTSAGSSPAGTVSAVTPVGVQVPASPGVATVPTSTPLTAVPSTSMTTPSSSVPHASTAPRLGLVVPLVGEVLALPEMSLLASPSVVAGGTVAFTVGGFVTGATVRLVVASDPQVLGSGVAGAAGLVAVSGIIPLDLSPGWHTLAVIDESGVGFRQAIMVSGAALPATGGLPVSPVVPLLLVVLGVLAMTGSRRDVRKPRGCDRR